MSLRSSGTAGARVSASSTALADTELGGRIQQAQKQSEHSESNIGPTAAIFSSSGSISSHLSSVFSRLHDAIIMPCSPVIQL